MAKLTTAQIKAVAKQKILAIPEGVRWTALVNEIRAEYPDTPINTIWGSTQTLFKSDPDISKIAKGIYAIGQNQAAKDSAASVPKDDPDTLIEAGQVISESDFYDSFAEWLRDGLDEVTEAISIGGNIFKSKWNTPDVIGVLRPLKGDLIKFDPQIVSAEIKIDPNQPVVAFGQAVSYRLFSHKCYLVLPETMTADDRDRVEALCTVFGLGLVTFKLDPENPDFTLQTRALLAQPDMAYVNQMAHRLNAYDNKAFDRLF